MKVVFAFLRCSALLAAALALSGCVSSKYKAAPKNTAPPVTLNLFGAQPPVEASVQSAIVYRGPGSWKREAYWDEYVVSIVCRGSEPLVLDSATLISLGNPGQAPGSDPWQLEKASRSALAHNFGLAKNVVVQLGGGLATVVAGTMIGSIIAPAGWILPAGAVPGFLIAIPVAVGGTIYRNISSRHDIENEFARRRLVLPVTLEPEKSAQGSLFFIIAPGPQRLVLRGRAGDAPIEVTVELAPLSGLHLSDKRP